MKCMDKVGDCYVKGIGVPINLSEALKYYKQAESVPKVNIKIGEIYEQGSSKIGVDHARAFDHYLQAGKSGDGDGFYKMGLLYEKIDNDQNSAMEAYKMGEGLGS